MLHDACGDDPRLWVLGRVPRIGNQWESASRQTRDFRLRCSLLVTRSGPNGMTESSLMHRPDLRQQMLAARSINLDAVFFTH